MRQQPNGIESIAPTTTPAPALAEGTASLETTLEEVEDNLSTELGRFIPSPELARTPRSALKDIS
eukprot:5246652-Pyramimonas_sp.AAC.1